jgi:hypothetical protein
LYIKHLPALYAAASAVFYTHSEPTQHPLSSQ